MRAATTRTHFVTFAWNSFNNFRKSSPLSCQGLFVFVSWSARVLPARGATRVAPRAVGSGCSARVLPARGAPRGTTTRGTTNAPAALMMSSLMSSHLMWLWLGSRLPASRLGLASRLVCYVSNTRINARQAASTHSGAALVVEAAVELAFNEALATTTYVILFASAYK